MIGFRAVGLGFSALGGLRAFRAHLCYSWVTFYRLRPIRNRIYISLILSQA